MQKTQSKNFLGKELQVIIDRPMGSFHPQYGFEYPVNYGFIPYTISADGEELDAYVLGINHPVNTFNGKCIAVIRRINDEDDKLIVVPKDTDISNEEILKLTYFQEQYFKSELIR